MTDHLIRQNKHGTYMQPVHPHVSKHRSYKIAVRTAKHRAEQVGMPMALVTWHDCNFVLMPAWMARATPFKVVRPFWRCCIKWW